MKLNYLKIAIAFSGIVAVSSCKKMMDINYNPDAIPDTNSPIAQLLSGVQVNIGFTAGSDLYRYTTQIMQQMSGLASQAGIILPEVIKITFGVAYSLQH